ncbi:MAG: hypothetical protein A2297_09815 [Elusimicrobia bacterium RIFOXYB2_FULL_48_7]|nr:MAG: hypothetical protein A2297_09815 [Elusimicrobia bacterium RIFOXYB2_FULL_48_7]
MFIVGFAALVNAENSAVLPVTGPATKLINTIKQKTTEEIQLQQPVSLKPPFVRGIHLTSWMAGSKKGRAYIDTLLNETEINTVVIDIKEYLGEVYIPGAKQPEEYKTYVNAMPDCAEYIKNLKKRNIYTIARIVVFKDDLLAKRKPEWAVLNSTGGVWQDRAGNSWLDPYNKNSWNYNIGIAKRAVELGFQG